jgi:hypothetical protein
LALVLRVKLIYVMIRGSGTSWWEDGYLFLEEEEVMACDEMSR